MIVISGTSYIHAEDNVYQIDESINTASTALARGELTKASEALRNASLLASNLPQIHTSWKKIKELENELLFLRDILAPKLTESGVVLAEKARTLSQAAEALRIGLTMLRTGQKDKARKAFESALELYQKHSDTNTQRRWIYKLLNDSLIY